MEAIHNGYGAERLRVVVGRSLYGATTVQTRFALPTDKTRLCRTWYRR